MFTDDVGWLAILAVVGLGLFLRWFDRWGLGCKDDKEDEEEPQSR